MLIKDQIKVRMEQLDKSVSSLARDLGVSSQSVQHWLSGRNFPGKAKCNLIETVLSFKLDFSEGAGDKGVTVEETLRNIDVDTLVAISKLTPRAKSLFASLAEEFVIAQSGASAAVAVAAEVAPVMLADRPGPAGSPNHGRRRVDLSARKTVR